MLRSATSSNINYGFCNVSYNGDWGDNGADFTLGVSPAFRIG